MDPKDGATPRSVLTPYLSAKELGAKLTAIGSYYGGKKSDAAALTPLESDAQAVPRCDPLDNCEWTCDAHEIKKVGDFVKWCIEPSLH
jgi:hypothetical protein